jgi:hypothetical protein
MKLTRILPCNCECEAQDYTFSAKMRVFHRMGERYSGSEWRCTSCGTIRVVPEGVTLTRLESETLAHVTQQHDTGRKTVRYCYDACDPSDVLIVETGR